MFSKFKFLKKALKRAKFLKSSEKKLHFFFCVSTFTWIDIISITKINANFFEFEVKSVFFLGSIQPQHTLLNLGCSFFSRFMK